MGHAPKMYWPYICIISDLYKLLKESKFSWGFVDDTHQNVYISQTGYNSLIEVAPCGQFWQNLVDCSTSGLKVCRTGTYLTQAHRCKSMWAHGVCVLQSGHQWLSKCLSFFSIASHSEHAHESKWCGSSAPTWSQYAPRGTARPTHAEPDEWTDTR